MNTYLVFSLFALVGLIPLAIPFSYLFAFALWALEVQRQAPAASASSRGATTAVWRGKVHEGSRTFEETTAGINREGRAVAFPRASIEIPTAASH
jgi:hypothetical protein